MALCAYFIIPDFPRTTRWLTEEEKQLAAWRLDEDIGADDWVNSKQQTFIQGAKSAATYATSLYDEDKECSSQSFRDMKSWLLLATTYGFTSQGTATTFFPT